MKKLNLICILLALGSCAELEEFITGEEKPLSEEEFRNYSKIGANNYCNSRKTINCEEFADKKFCEEFTALDCNCVVNSLYPKLTFGELKEVHGKVFSYEPIDEFVQIRKGYRVLRRKKNKTKLDEFNYTGIDLNELVYNTNYGYASVKKCVNDYVVNDIKQNYEADLKEYIRTDVANALIKENERQFGISLGLDEKLLGDFRSFRFGKYDFKRFRIGNNALCKEAQCYGGSDYDYTPEVKAVLKRELWKRKAYDCSKINCGEHVAWTVIDKFFTKAEENKIFNLWSVNDRLKEAEQAKQNLFFEKCEIDTGVCVVTEQTKQNLFFEIPNKVVEYLSSSEIQNKFIHPQYKQQRCSYYDAPEIVGGVGISCDEEKTIDLEYKKDMVEWAKEKGIY